MSFQSQSGQCKLVITVYVLPLIRLGSLTHRFTERPDVGKWKMIKKNSRLIWLHLCSGEDEFICDWIWKKGLNIWKIDFEKIEFDIRQSTFGPFSSICHYTWPEPIKNFQVAGEQKINSWRMYLIKFTLKKILLTI